MDVSFLLNGFPDVLLPVLHKIFQLNQCFLDDCSIVIAVNGSLCVFLQKMFCLDSAICEVLYSVYLPTFLHIPNSTENIFTNTSGCLYTMFVYSWHFQYVWKVIKINNPVVIEMCPNFQFWLCLYSYHSMNIQCSLTTIFFKVAQKCCHN